MIDPIHLIRVDLNDQPRIIFEADYRPTTGPLPKRQYPLIGLWVHNGMIVRALFEAARVPTHEHEPIFHRYEGPEVVHQGQARYRYFTVPGYAGMILTKKSLVAAGIPVEEVWASLHEGTNQQQATEWAAKYNTSPGPVCPTLIRISDLLGGLPPIILCTIPQEERQDSSDDHYKDEQPTTSAA